MSKRGHQTPTPLIGLFAAIILSGPGVVKPASLELPSGSPNVTGCIASDIPHAQLTFENDDTKLIKSGDLIPEGVSITYKCDRGYTREGSEFNLCFKSEWQQKPEPQCIKFCSHEPLEGITFSAACELDGAPVACGDRSRPGTVARITCRRNYKVPRGNPPTLLLCQENGYWDYEPFRCEPICGEEPPKVTQFVLDGTETFTTKAPWHVGIYNKLNGVYTHHCDGTIIGAKVVLSAAHCFWDTANQKPYSSSLYVVGAGKYHRNYTATETIAQFRNISSIVIPVQYAGEVNNREADIAVLVLENFLIFSQDISPVCINREISVDREIPRNTFGRLSGWDIVDENEESNGYLQSADVLTTSYTNCSRLPSPTYVPSDHFCALKYNGQACLDDTGGGLTVKKSLGNIEVHYLVGILSNPLPNTSGISSDHKCRAFATFTNMRYFERLLMDLEIANRPR